MLTNLAYFQQQNNPQRSDKTSLVCQDKISIFIENALVMLSMTLTRIYTHPEDCTVSDFGA